MAGKLGTVFSDLVLAGMRRQGGSAFGRSYRNQLYAMLAPYLAGIVLLVVTPALLSFALAFAHYGALGPPRWAGIQNFKFISADPLLGIAIRNSLYFIVLAVPLRVVGALLLALLLNRPRKGIGVYRTAVCLPTVVPDVAYALIWLWILNPRYGPLNQTLGFLGLPTPAWLVNPATAKSGFVLMALFQIGEGFIVLLAGLQNIPHEYFESAQIDGGGRLSLLRHITLPMLSPWLVLLTFRDVILTFQYTFTPSFVMTGGDPYYATLFLPLLIFEEAFDRFRFGTGSAMMLIMFLTTLILLLVLFRLFKGWGYDD
jgi:multiple sugar transport system permease protein